MGEGWIRAAAAEDLIEGEGYESDVEIDGGSIALFLVDGTIYGLGSCTHEGGPLGQGALRGHTVVCPWHSARFDVKTGACLDGPSACRVDGSVGAEEGETTERLEPCTVLETRQLDGAIYVRRRTP
ncbi:MAG: Rieske (2Fe-2S) protein [Rhodospirillales bacterium]|nr:MAG: Rieske (2Fe-2S) protein [Rhodospirillales bacterium]